ncbi:MAG: MFS transporter [Candidatus Gastranaerophilales bacterium]|nr:MFS transporter [Candidatus Gastranaerophilales bacterium]
MEEKNELKRFTTVNFLNFALGFLGLQFAWQMRIILSAPVTEGLGASPFIYGLIWLAGPFTGMVVQPLVGVLSDSTKSRFGRRRPYLLAGALITAVALWAFPNSAGISDFIGNILHLNMPAWSGLLIAAVMIWVIDACINIAQGPYRALVPDVVPVEQHSVANSYISLAIGLGSVIAAATAPVLKYVLHYQMSVQAQFVMAALAFSLAMIWTCMTIKEKSSLKTKETVEEKNNQSFAQSLKEFFLLSPEVAKICVMQFFTWIGMMCLMIFFTNFAIHTVYNVPDLTKLSPDIQLQFSDTQTTATNYSSICFAIFNLICFIIAVPIGFLAARFGNKKVHIIALLSMVLAYIGIALFKTNLYAVAFFMALSGIGWASVCALPFAMLSRYIKAGTEGSVMGIFNIFIAGPQVFVCTLVAWIIDNSAFNTGSFMNYHYEYSFYIGAICLLLAAAITNLIKEPDYKR